MASHLVRMGFTEATETRRSIRQLSAKSTIPDSTIVRLAEEAILNVPSAFNSQTSRLAVLFGDDHNKLWTMTADAMLAKIGEERWNEGSKDRINNYLSSHGTILFFDDSAVAAAMKENAPAIYKDKTEDWVHQSSGMHQYYMWTAMAALGMGVNVQHYNPLIDEEVKKTWNMPSNWRLRAQMVFGVPREGSEPGEKLQKSAVEERVRVFGTSAKM